MIVVGVKAVLVGGCVPLLPCFLVAAALREVRAMRAGKAAGEISEDSFSVAGGHI